VTTLLVCRLSSVPIVSASEFAVLDAWLRSREPRQPDPNIALVGIRRSVAEEYREERDPDCSCELIPRSDIGRAVARIKAAGAKVVVIDLLFSQSCQYKEQSGSGAQPTHDEVLREAIEQPPNTVMAAEADLDPSGLYFQDPPGTLADYPDLLQDPDLRNAPGPTIASPVVYSPYGVVRGVSLIQFGKPTKGAVTEVNPLEMKARLYPALCIAAYAALKGSPTELPTEVDDRHVKCVGEVFDVWPSRSIRLLEPLGVERESAPSGYAMLINWAGPPGTFTIHSLRGVLRADDKTLVDRFAGKVVFVGFLGDREVTAMDRGGGTTMTGLEIHANALQTILSRRFIRPVPTPIVWALIFVASYLTTVIFRSFGTLRAVAALAIGILALLLLARTLLVRDYWLVSATPILAMAFSGSVAAIWGYARARQEGQALAEQLQAIDAATSTVVHDLKQPLAAIAALAAVLRQRQTKGKLGSSPEVLERIQGQVDRALGDIDTLLMADPDRQVVLQLEHFDLVQTARDIAVAQSLASPVHDVQVRAPEEGAWIVADPGYLIRALSNLIDNAIKYWPEGGTVIVEIEPSGTNTIVRVIDRGTGIAPEKQAAVFERFQRAVDDGSRIPGTGVGLYSVKRIVEAHGGTIELQSEVGAGSTFIVALPTGLGPDQATVAR
jgi:signal transduction histidine kinase